MAKKPSRGKGRGKGNLNVIIGTPNPVVQPTPIPLVYQEEFADVAVIDNQDLRVPGTSLSPVDILPDDILVDNDIENDEIEVIMENHEVDFDCISMGA